MANPPEQVIPHAIPRLRGNRLLAVLALVALAVSAGFFYWSSVTQVAPLNLGAGVELRYRKELIGILSEEAAAKGLQLNIQSNGSRSADAAIGRVNRGELDAAVIPAGLAIQAENVRQVAILECEVLHLFVKPEVLAQGMAGLKGQRINLGPAGSGVRILATEILQFIGMKSGEDYQDDTRSFIELKDLAPQMMPDAVFSLSPLPSPLGERLVQRYGYQLMELPFGEAIALRKPYFEDATVPANTYGVHPAVPAKPLHTVGTRSVLIAHRDVPKVAVRRLIEVLYESDFARRVCMQPLDVNLLHRSGEYPSHAGTTAYLHRHDPWVNADLIENLKKLRGMLVSAVSALVLAWEWYRRRRVEGVDDHLRACNKMELDALRASARSEFGEADLRNLLVRLAELKILALEKHEAGLFAGDQQFLQLVSRIETLQQTLRSLVLTPKSSEQISLALPQPLRKAS